MLLRGVLDGCDAFRFCGELRWFGGTGVAEVPRERITSLWSGVDSDHRLVRIFALVQVEDCAENVVGGWC